MNEIRLKHGEKYVNCNVILEIYVFSVKCDLKDFSKEVWDAY